MEQRLQIVESDLLRGSDLPVTPDDVERIASRVEIAREPLRDLAVLEMRDQLPRLSGVRLAAAQWGSSLAGEGAGVASGFASPAWSEIVNGME